MWPDRVSNPGPLTYESGALPTAQRGPAGVFIVNILSNKVLIISKYTILAFLFFFFFFLKLGPSCLCLLVCPIDLIRIRLQNIIKIFKTTSAISTPQLELHASGLLSLTSQELEVWSRSHFKFPTPMSQYATGAFKGQTQATELT